MPKHGASSRRTPRASRVAIGLTCAATALAVAPLPQALVDRWYSRGLYPRIQGVVTPAMNQFSVAAFDLFVGAAVLTLLVVIVRTLRARSYGWVRTVGGAIGLVLAAAAGLYLWFAVAWGLNYRRSPVETYLVQSSGRTDTGRVLALGRRAVAALNADHARAHGDGWATPEWQNDRLRVAFAAAQASVGQTTRAVPGRLKATVFGPYFRWAGVDGMVSPFTLEVLANPDLLPFERPFVAAHEWGHLAGFADEAEASFIGLLTCMRAGISERYSAWLFVLWQVRAEVPADARTTLDRELAPGPRADMTAVAARIQRGSQPVVRRASWAAYDQYLRANHVEDGVRSYGRVLELLTTVRLDAAWTPTLVAPADLSK